MSHAIEQLQATRQALIDALRPRPSGRAAGPAPAASATADATGTAYGPSATDAVASAARRAEGWGHRMLALVRRWWRFHPVHAAADLAAPALADYGARRPWRFLGIAALAGALFTVARPWRLVSLTTLLVALLKSSALREMLQSAMAEEREALHPESRVNNPPRSTP